MTGAEPTFSPDAYVVRYGRRGFPGTLAALLVCTAITVYVLVSGRPVLTDVIVLVFEAGLLVAFGVDLSKAASARYMIDAGRADLLPGADGTIRYAYRRMRGWRADRMKVAEATARFAPTIPVANGPNWPPQITRTDAMTARRTRRG